MTEQQEQDLGKTEKVQQQEPVPAHPAFYEDDEDECDDDGYWGTSDVCARCQENYVYQDDSHAWLCAECISLLDKEDQEGVA